MKTSLTFVERWGGDSNPYKSANCWCELQANA
jgi:hypothetical protein